MPAPLEVTEYELAVLDCLWGRPGATIREITETIYGHSRTAAYATVQKLLERLEKKKCVVRDRATVPHVFRARVERGQLIGRGLSTLASKLCNGSLSPLLMHLVSHTKLTKQERETLRRLIDES